MRPEFFVSFFPLCDTALRKKDTNNSPYIKDFREYSLYFFALMRGIQGCLNRPNIKSVNLQPCSVRSTLFMFLNFDSDFTAIHEFEAQFLILQNRYAIHHISEFVLVVSLEHFG